MGACLSVRDPKLEITKINVKKLSKHRPIVWGEMHFGILRTV